MKKIDLEFCKSFIEKNKERSKLVSEIETDLKNNTKGAFPKIEKLGNLEHSLRNDKLKIEEYVNEGIEISYNQIVIYSPC